MTSEEISKLIDTTLANLYSTYDIFKEYYGENRVDLQGIPSIDYYTTYSEYNTVNHLRNLQYKIYVYFPQVTVTNENNKSINITNLWAEISLLYDGRLVNRFRLNRTEYPLSHILSDYMHSHVCGIPIDDMGDFLVPCTGTGPINRTITSLCTMYDASLWQLFCYELDLYTKTESLQGVPYRRLENVNNNNIRPQSNDITNIVSLSGIMLDFYKYLIKTTDFKFSYINNGYYLGMSYLQFRILISDKFIKWFNDSKNPYNRAYNGINDLLSILHLDKCIIKDNRAYVKSRLRPSNFRGHSSKEELITYLKNQHLFKFKGKDVTLNIIDDLHEDNNNYVLLLNTSIVDSIINKILLTINSLYGTEYNTSDRK